MNGKQSQEKKKVNKHQAAIGSKPWRHFYRGHSTSMPNVLAAQPDMGSMPHV